MPPSGRAALGSCTLLLARRLYPQAPNNRLGTLAAEHRLPNLGRAHQEARGGEFEHVNEPGRVALHATGSGPDRLFPAMLAQYLLRMTARVKRRVPQE